MRDVGSQLAEYFEAATERIDAEDVLAHVRVTEQAQRPVRRRLRPAWVAAAGFVGVLALVGGALLAGVLLHDPTAVEPQPLGTPVAETGAGWGWWPLAVAGAALLVAVVIPVSRRLRRATKEVDMQGVHEKRQETAEVVMPRRSNRRWFIGLTVAAVVAGAIAAWIIIDANQSDDLAVASDFADTWVDAWETRGGQELAALFTEDGVWVDGFGPFEGRTAIRAHVATFGLFTNAQHGEVLEVRDGVFTFPVEAVWYSADWAGEVEIQLEGDLVAHAELVGWEQLD